MPYNARFLYQQPKTEINNYLIVNWFSLPLQTVEKHLVSNIKSISFLLNRLIYNKKNQLFFWSCLSAGLFTLSFAGWKKCITWDFIATSLFVNALIHSVGKNGFVCSCLPISSPFVRICFEMFLYALRHIFFDLYIPLRFACTSRLLLYSVRVGLSIVGCDNSCLRISRLNCESKSGTVC